MNKSHICHKCNKEMMMTPVCCECGIVPITEGSFAAKDREILRLKNFLRKLLRRQDLSFIKLLIEVELEE